MRATCNTSGGTISQDRKLGRLVNAHPAVGEALMVGRISADHALEIARVHSNRRVSALLGVVVAVFVDQAEHRSYDEFRVDIDQFINTVDQDGAFAHIADNVEHRNARVSDLHGCLDVAATGGDPVVAAQLVTVFDMFVQAEFQRDVDARAAEHGAAACEYPLARTAAQRRFDALVAIFAAAAGSPQAAKLPEPVVNIVIDHGSISEAFACAAIVLPNGNLVDLGELADEAMLVRTLADELVADPEAFRGRYCETSTGAAIPAFVALQAAFTGHVRRVVVDSDRVVVDFGTRQRLFTGNARIAAQLMSRFCTFPGCRIPARLCQVDHNIEWVDGGATDQANANIECGPHNRHKHRNQWRTRTDARGRVYHLKPDGTIVLPVGERPPDLTIDEQRHLTQTRLANLIV